MVVLFANPAAANVDDPYCTADIVYVLDGSGGISTSQYTMAKEFLASLTNRLTIGTSSLHTSVGMVVFDHRTFVEFALGQFTSNSATAAAVLNAPHPRGLTCIACGMNAATNDVFIAPGDRHEGQTNAMIVLTDGRDWSDVANARLGAERKKIVVYAIGVGIGISIPQLEAATGDSSRVFTADSFENLQSVLGPILRKICPGLLEPVGDKLPAPVKLDES